jgi:hypothetical protein
MFCRGGRGSRHAAPRPTRSQSKGQNHSRAPTYYWNMRLSWYGKNFMTLNTEPHSHTAAIRSAPLPPGLLLLQHELDDGLPRGISVFCLLKIMLVDTFC